KTILAGAPSTPLILSGSAHMKYSVSSISFNLTPSSMFFDFLLIAHSILVFHYVKKKPSR
ncbi:MAG TPA: hypothetical protein VIK26_00250, partial [Clostridium sp.]